MRIFNFFTRPKDSGKNSKNSVWKELTQFSQLDQMEEISFKSKVLIFKHSKRCGISSSVLHRLESKISEGSYTIPFYFLDLLSYRDLSDEISTRYNVTHQSPQLLVISKGNSVQNLSHYDILDIDLNGIQV